MFIDALGNSANALFLLASVYVYVALSRQIAARPTDEIADTARAFGVPDSLLAGVFILLFTWLALTANADAAATMRTREMIGSVVVEIVVLGAVLFFLKLRGRDVPVLAGLNKITFTRAAVTGSILLIAAFPLIVLADVITTHWIGITPTPQGIVELFNNTNSSLQRVLIILIAVVFAPIIEEFFFRFFLYGVLRRNVGKITALVATSLLFAGVHAHIPSLAPLFTLAVCFTIAYEWTGSILVTMTMHSVFNAVQLFGLALSNPHSQ